MDSFNNKNSCFYRMMIELQMFEKNPPPGILVTSDEFHSNVIHALIFSICDSPYYGGFFHFVLTFPIDYPFKPPHVKFMTTGGSQVRFHPKIHESGKVSLDMLEDKWAVEYTLPFLLTSIQNLLNEKPYHSEPGYESEKVPGDVEKYNEVIIHETLRVAVIGMLNNDFGVVMPFDLQLVIKKHFMEHHIGYRTQALAKLCLNGKSMQDPFGINKGTFDYETILQKLQQLEVTLSPFSSKNSTATSTSTTASASSLPFNPTTFSSFIKTPTPQVTRTADKSQALRIMKEIMKFNKDPPPGIMIDTDEADLTTIHALILGPANTPYEGGFFYFVLNFPPSYPWVPPVVTLMTTGAGKVSFNPNLYQDGQVCLSILGTWHGPVWTPVITITTLLVSIQSLLNEKPYHNEPGYEKEDRPGQVDSYNSIIRHETLRVAVVGMLDKDFGIVMPQGLQSLMEKRYLENHSFYKSQALSNAYLDGQLMQDPFRTNRGTFDYKTILKRLEQINDRLKSPK